MYVGNGVGVALSIGVGVGVGTAVAAATGVGVDVRIVEAGVILTSTALFPFMNIVPVFPEVE